ncbi:MAG: hypothetical protein HKL90_13105 [Elusimicrobia bacterium]|nr:hypothetical protein [Elusimicrobiota bacterium]
MSELRLDIHGWRARLSGDAQVLEELRRDFAFFVRADLTDFAEELELIGQAPSPGRLDGWPLWIGRGHRICVGHGERRISYADGAAAAFDFTTRRGKVWSASPERLRELGYLLVLSRAGEALDAVGLHRVHALGFEWKNSAGLLLLPSGGGKSELALALLRHTEAGILSDDTPLVDSTATAHAFPLRMGFRPSADLSEVPERWVRPFLRSDYAPKRVVDYDFFRDRVRGGLPVRWLLIGRKSAGAPKISAIGDLSAATALLTGLVVGHGVAQMAEYRLRPTDAWGLTRDAFFRARTARALLRRVQTRTFALGTNPRGAALALADFLSASSRY